VSGRPKPPPEAIEAALETLAEEFSREHPGVEARVHRPGRPLPPGAVQLPAVCEDDLPQPVLDRPARDRRRDDDPLDQ
jgi:hypothetical protein